MSDNIGTLRLGCYARYNAFMTAGSRGTLTPDFTKVQLTHSGTNTSSLQLFEFDGAGNPTKKTTETDSSTTVETRTINDLNQITANVITGGSSASWTYTYDAANNLTSKTVETASGTRTDDRTSFVVGTITNGSSTVSSVSTADLALLAVGETIDHPAFADGTTVLSKSSSSFVASTNATASAAGATIGFGNRLNQIMRQVITPAGGSPATWRYSYNLNGCMTGKTDGTNTWTYTWDDENRLSRVQGPGSVDVTYQYDQMGRMLTRTSGGVTTQFIWDGWNCFREFDGTNTIRYYCPQGEILSLERNSTYYQVHSDALGSIRALTDSSGAVVASFTYGPWGETLSASHPSGWTLSYLFVGALGVRFDSAVGLYYMLNRWYDAGLGRFLSRDALAHINFYEYARNSPISYNDPNGLDPNQLDPAARNQVVEYLSNARAGKFYKGSPYLNQGSSYNFNPGDAELEPLVRMPGPAGIPTIVIHGFPSAHPYDPFLDSRKDYAGERLTATQLATRAVSAGAVPSGDGPVILLSCNAATGGKHGPKKGSSALILAKKLNRPVIAPANSTIATTLNGFFLREETGSWTVTYPNGTSETLPVPAGH